MNRLPRPPCDSITPLRRLLRFGVAVFVLSGCDADGDPIRIGLAGPMPGEYGTSVQQGAALAVSQLNSAGGVRGRRIELAARDDSGQAAVAVRVASEFHGDPSIVAVVGHVTSAATIAAAPIYNRAPTPVLHISPTASSPDAADLGAYTFRICPDDRTQGRQLTDWTLQRFGAGTATILYRNDADGRGLSAAFQSAFTRSGGRIESADPFIPSLPSLEPYLTRIRSRGGTDVLLVAGDAGDAARVLATLDSVGIDPIVLGGTAMAGIERFSPEANGIVVSTHYLTDGADPRNQDFVAAYRRANGGELPDHTAAGAYDIVHILARAIEAVGVDRARLRDYVAGLGSSTDAFIGVTGRIAFDARGDAVGRDVMIAAVHDGQLVAVREP